MLAKILVAVAMLCMFSAGFATRSAWRTWSDDAEIDFGTITLGALLLLLGVAFAATGAAV